MVTSAAAAAAAATAYSSGEAPVNSASAVTGLTVEELQAAYDAARRGDFAGRRYVRSGAGGYDELLLARPRLTSSAGSAGELEAVLPWRGAVAARTSGAAATVSRWPVTGSVVAVLAAHAGAGASTVAVAIAEAVAAGGTPTRLVELADPARSGLAAAATAELGVDGSGWRHGRRGPLLIDRLAEHVGGLSDLPAPRSGEPGVSECVVVDPGCPAGEVLAGGGWPAQLLAVARLVVVCRLTVPAVRQAEPLLTDLRNLRSMLVAAPGRGRWPGAVTASCGPGMRAMREAARVVTVPLDRRLQVYGVTADPLPRPIAVAGEALATRLMADQPAACRAG
jgi:hypothetical protein